MQVFTILGPAHTGKSTLAQAMAGLDGASDAHHASLSETVDVHQFNFLGDSWTVIDIAGGPENLPSAGPALAASDAAILCVSAETDSAVLSAPYLRMIEEAGLPCFIFVNKIDAEALRMRDVVADLQTYCRHGLVLRQIPIRQDGQVVGAVDLVSERAWQYRKGHPSALIELPASLNDRESEARSELLESLADFDDALLEQLIEDKRPATDEVFDLVARTVQHSDLIEVFMGAALKGNGVHRLMKSLRHDAPGHDVLTQRLGAGEDTLAVTFGADIRKHVGKIVAIRALGTRLRSGDRLGGSALGNMTGFDGKTAITTLEPGQVGLAVKSDHLSSSQMISAEDHEVLPVWALGRGPGFNRIVSPVHDRDDVRLSSALERLGEIDSGLMILADKASGKAVLSGQGPVHARRLVDKLEADFGIAVELSPVTPEYRETITRTVETQHRHRKQSGGAGQFADVRVRISPLARGTGFEFGNQVKGGAVPRNYSPAVATGAGEALRAGVAGYPVVDVRVDLLDGKHHAVDSSDHAFSIAGKNAVREALQSAGCKMLQPILQVDIQVPSVFAGGLAPLVSGLKGQVQGFQAHPTAAGWDVFSCQLPASAAEDLFRVLAGATRGTAWFSTEFDHYQQVSADEVARAQVAANPQVA